MNYCFDLDGTICNTPLRKEDLKPGYLEATPFPFMVCLLYTSPSPRDATLSRMPSSA